MKGTDGVRRVVSEQSGAAHCDGQDGSVGGGGAMRSRRKAAQTRQGAAQKNGAAAGWMTVDHGCAITMATTKRGARQLTDPKGLGIPPYLKGEAVSKDRKTTSLSVYQQRSELLRMVAEEFNDVNMSTIKAYPDTPDDDTMDEINPVYAALMALTSNEAFDIVLGAGNGVGFEDWRRLNLRYDLGPA